MVGSSKTPIDYEAVKKLTNIQCTQEEIASFLGVPVRTLQRDKEIELYRQEKRYKEAFTIRESVKTFFFYKKCFTFLYKYYIIYM